MDMDKAREIVREQIEKHRAIAGYAEKIDVPMLANEHTEIAEAMELLLGVGK